MVTEVVGPAADTGEAYLNDTAEKINIKHSNIDTRLNNIFFIPPSPFFAFYYLLLVLVSVRILKVPKGGDV